jgi:hypothetical protein
LPSCSCAPAQCARWSSTSTPTWTTAYIFEQTDPNNPAAIFGDKLLPDMKRNGDRYLVPGERDFVTMVARY